MRAENMQNLPQLSDKKSRIWRWNVDPVWAHFSTMIQENFTFYKAKTDFDRHHASKSCLYFGVAAVEAFINQELRKIMHSKGCDENTISTIISQSRKWKEKQEWLKASPFSAIFEDEKYIAFCEYKKIRNEVTHSSRPDHLVFNYLEIANAEEFISLVQYILVKTCELQNTAFQYWMLGWNYVGCNHSELEPSLNNNLQSFYWSLKYMQIERVRNISQDSFLKNCMTGCAAFTRLQAELDEYPFDIEPKHPVLSPPRLTRCWWDHDILDSDSIENCENDSSRPGCKIVWAIISDSTHECFEYFNARKKAEYICRVSYHGCRVAIASYSEKYSNVILLNT